MTARDRERTKASLGYLGRIELANGVSIGRATCTISRRNTDDGK